MHKFPFIDADGEPVRYELCNCHGRQETVDPSSVIGIVTVDPERPHVMRIRMDSADPMYAAWWLECEFELCPKQAKEATELLQGFHEQLKRMGIDDG